MLVELAKSYADQMASLELLLQVITIVVHVLFAGAVAKDAGRLIKQEKSVIFVSGLTWSFATLVGGVMVAAVYWFIHHFTIK